MTQPPLAVGFFAFDFAFANCQLLFALRAPPTRAGFARDGVGERKPWEENEDVDKPQRGDRRSTLVRNGTTLTAGSEIVHPLTRWKPRTLVRGSGLLSPRKTAAIFMSALALVPSSRVNVEYSISQTARINKIHWRLNGTVSWCARRCLVAVSGFNRVSVRCGVPQNCVLARAVYSGLSNEQRLRWHPPTTPIPVILERSEGPMHFVWNRSGTPCPCMILPFNGVATDHSENTMEEARCCCNPLPCHLERSPPRRA